MSLEERAREFASTDLQLNDALSGEDIVRLITDFAAPYEAALRECHAALSAYQDANRLHNDGEAELYNAADKALESASELLEGGNDDI